MEKLLPKLRFLEFSGEWEEKKLGDVGEVKMCKRIFNDETSLEAEIPFYKIGSFGKVADAFIIKEKYLDFRKKYSFPSKGDILISAAGTIGRTVVYNGEDAYYQDSNIVWISNDYSTVSNEFLFYIYQIVKYNTEGGTIQRLYNNILKSTKFNTPSHSEQTKIATFLTAVDEKLNALKQKKTLLEKYKKGVMQQIFSQELRFKDDNGNDFSGWEEKKLGDLGAFRGGGTPSTQIQEYWKGEIPWISSSDLIENDVMYIKTTKFINERAISESATKIIPANSVLFVARVGVGKLAVNTIEICTSQDFTNFIPNETNSIYLAYYFIKNNNLLNNYAQGTSIKGFTSGDLKSIIIDLPCLKEQTKIANFLSAIDEKINHCQGQIEKTQVWKKGLLQQLFV